MDQPENNIPDEWWNYIWSPRFLQMKNSSDPLVKKYAYRVARSDGMQQTLLGMACTVLLEKTPLNVLEDLLKGYPEDFGENLGSVLLETFRVVLDFWRGSDIPAGIDYDEMCEYDMMAVFEHILNQVPIYFQNGGNSVTNEEFLQELWILGTDVVVLAETRVEALGLAEQYLTFDKRVKEVLETLRCGEEVASPE
ncbi:uncharacterized protein LOC125032020 isoform X2 [Penaeus chinensis]|uniref:uncharacterized protein LOC125032020 isoform X2 n=1 Tax=Penaeus chinensis TaxID=139456 RepID=UPI001FB7CD7E|nr:uncharacterized protein LOC125032020 isoform X2 [Penaeus chinensis]